MKLRLELTNDIKCISPALSFVEALSRERGLSEKQNKQFQLALEEILSNVVQYAFDNDEEHSFDVLISDTPSFIEIKIREMGIPFVLEHAQQYDPTQIRSVEDAFNQKGLGTYLVSRMVDKLEFQYLGAKGKETTLVKYINNPQVTEYKIETAPVVNYKKEDVTIHLFEDKEALSVARCLYTAYGYTYVKFAMYEPAYLREIAKKDDTIIVTAVANDGEVAGVIIGSEDEGKKGIMEIGSMVVSPKFRGLRIGESIGETLRDKIAESGRNGAFAVCVSIHLGSQRALAKVGLKPCLVFVNYRPNIVKYKKLEGQVSERQTFVVYYLPFVDRPNGVYLPERHADKIDRIYKRLEVGYQQLTESRPLPELSNIVVQRNDTLEICMITVKEIGADVNNYLTNLMRLPEFNKINTWCVYLNMRDANLNYAVEEMEKSNFVFTGILPGANEGDLLVMQQLTDVKWIREETLLADPERDSWMLDFIEERCKEVGNA